MPNIFVVMGEPDDYDSRPSLRGVFETREAAQAFVEQRATARAEYQKWQAAFDAARPRRPFGYFKFPLSPEQQSESDELDAIAVRAAGPKTEYESASYFTIYEAEIGANLDPYLHGEHISVPPEPEKPKPEPPTSSEAFWALPPGPEDGRWPSEYVPIVDDLVMAVQDTKTNETWALGMYLDGAFFRRAFRGGMGA